MEPNPEPGSMAAYLHAALAEVDRLTEQLALHRAPLPGSPVARPEPDPVYALIERQRADLETGFTDWPYAVGLVLCPAREKCSERIDSVFKPMWNGRLPMHRNSFGQACPGAHQKPVTPRLKLRPHTPPAEDHTPKSGAAWVDVRRAQRLSFGVRKVDPVAETNREEQP
jgi:hypothetical protein